VVVILIVFSLIFYAIYAICFRLLDMFEKNITVLKVVIVKFIFCTYFCRKLFHICFRRVFL